MRINVGLVVVIFGTIFGVALLLHSRDIDRNTINIKCIQGIEYYSIVGDDFMSMAVAIDSETKQPINCVPNGNQPK